MERADTGPVSGPEHTPESHADIVRAIVRANALAHTSDPTNTCPPHTHGDVCGDCGFGMGTFDSPDFAGYCD